MTIRASLKKTRIIPVITIRHVEHAVPLAQTLMEAGLDVLEITLRTTNSLEALQRIQRELPKCRIAVGTVLTAEQFQKIQNINPLFAVSPGITSHLVQTAVHLKIPYLPGVTTCTEIMQGKELGLNEFKFFPAGLSGGTKALQNYYELFPDTYFCPTGGVTEENMNDYLALPNVFCIGGSWIAPSHLIENTDWKTISERAHRAQEHLQ